MNDEVVLVNEKDELIGTAGKLEAHKKGLLHRAFSVFIFNDRGEMLLQQRALDKYHSGGLWSNTCCSHPGPGEDIGEAAIRRLKEEMGFKTGLEKIFDFIYRSEFKNGLTEYEFDHVFTGVYNGPVNYNKNEVMDSCYKDIDEISMLLENQSLQFTSWFRIVFPRIKDWKNNYFKEYGK